MEESRFKIGQAARMIGISPETLRYYEQKGIIRPDKEQASQYRTYNMQDICILIRVRMYLQYGFTLEEVRRMLYEEDEHYTDRMLRSRIQKLDDEIAHLTMTRRNMSRRYLELLDVMRNVGHYSIEECPSMALLEIVKNGGGAVPREVQREYSRWVNDFLDSFPYVEYVVDQENKIRETLVGQGLVLPQEDGDTKNMLQLEHVNVYPPCRCLRTGAVAYQSERGSMLAYLDDIFRYMEEHGLRHKGRILARTIYVGSEGDSYKYFRDIWIPLAEEDR